MELEFRNYMNFNLQYVLIVFKYSIFVFALQKKRSGLTFNIYILNTYMVPPA